MASDSPRVAANPITGVPALLRTPLGRFRLVALAEGVSVLVLLLIAMPLKYVGGHPEPVFYVGLAHGILFILYLITLALVASEKGWRRARVFGAWVPSGRPAGTFVLEIALRRDQRAEAITTPPGA